MRAFKITGKIMFIGDITGNNAEAKLSVRDKSVEFSARKHLKSARSDTVISSLSAPRRSFGLPDPKIVLTHFQTNLYDTTGIWLRLLNILCCHCHH